MAFLDFLTGGNAKRAFNRNQTSINEGLAAGTSALNQGAGRAQNLLGVNGGGTALEQLGAGYDAARSDVQSGYGQQQDYLGGLQSLYDPLVSSGQQALGARDDAMGLNGAEGYGRAKSAFQNSLGYNSGLSTGLEAIMRSAASRGMLASGNTSRDLYDYAADFQNRQSGAYLDRLTGASQNLNAGLAGRAGGLQLQGAAAGSLGTQLGTLSARRGEGAAGLYQTGAGIESGLGTSLANLNNFATQQRIGNSNTLSQGEGAASANIFGLAKSLLSPGNLAAIFK